MTPNDTPAPAPTGYRNPAVFRDLVMRFSPAAEPFDESVGRLWDCVQFDARRLGVEAALTPERVAYAYRHHTQLRLTKADLAAGKRPPAPRHVAVAIGDMIKRIKEREEVAAYMREMTCRIQERKRREAEEDAAEATTTTTTTTEGLTASC